MVEPPIWKILVKHDYFPNFRGEQKNVWNNHLGYFFGGKNWTHPVYTPKKLTAGLEPINHHDFEKEHHLPKLRYCVPTVDSRVFVHDFEGAISNHCSFRHSVNFWGEYKMVHTNVHVHIYIYTIFMYIQLTYQNQLPFVKTFDFRSCFRHQGMAGPCKHFHPKNGPKSEVLRRRSYVT